MIGILWKVGGNRRRRGNGSCCPAASGTSGWRLFELELLDCHNTYELTLIRIHLRKESSKLLLLAPHNDTIDDLEGLMDAAAPDYPPTLYDFYLACIYRQDFLAANLDKFQFTNHQGTTITPVAQAVSPLAIHKLISADPTLQATLEARASLPTIVNIALTYPRGFVTYCTISNTVKAIGIGGSASLFLSAKFTSFIASSDEADARNLVALTRSKGLSVILLPSATPVCRLSPSLSSHSMCLSARNFQYRGGGSRHRGPCKLLITTRHDSERGTCSIHLGIMATYTSNIHIWHVEPTSPVPRSHI